MKILKAMDETFTSWRSVSGAEKTVHMEVRRYSRTAKLDVFTLASAFVIMKSRGKDATRPAATRKKTGIPKNLMART